MSAPLPPGVSYEQVSEILHRINICQYAERESVNGHISYKTDTRVPGLDPITRDALRRSGLPISDNPSVYADCIRRERDNLVKLNPLESDDIETLRNIRTKYVAAEEIKAKIEHDFTNYQEFEGFMQQSQEQLRDTRKYLDAKLSKLIRARDEARRANR